MASKQYFSCRHALEGYYLTSTNRNGGYVRIHNTYYLGNGSVQVLLSVYVSVL